MKINFRGRIVNEKKNSGIESELGEGEGGKGRNEVGEPGGRGVKINLSG